MGADSDELLLAAINREDPILYGQRLFEALFASEKVRAGYSDVLGRARHTDQRLRLRLYIAATGTDPGLHRHHWEYLYDPWHRFPVGCSAETAFSRYLSVEHAAPPPVSGLLRLLVVLSAPGKLEETPLGPLDRDEMKRSIEESLEPLAGLVDYRFVEPPVTLSRVREHLVGFEAHALLFQGHGLLRHGEAAGLVLEDAEGDLAICSEEEVAAILRDRRELRLVTLLACHSGTPSTDDPYSGLGPALIRCGVPAVVAMRRQVTLENTSLFLRHFFLNLSWSGRVDAAVNEARMQLYTRNPRSWDWGIPILFMRLKDARLWKDPPAVSPAIRSRPLSYSDLWWEPILEQLELHRIIPILGPGLVHGLLPTKEEVAAVLADKYSFPWNGSDRRNLPHVAQFAETQSDARALSNTYRKILRDELLERQKNYEPIGLADPKKSSLSVVIEEIAERYFADDLEEPHHVLAGLPIENYITTNIDNFMTAALKRVGNKAPNRRYCLWHEKTESDELIGEYEDLVGTFENPLVFHLFGHDEAPIRYQVLTEDDYLDFLRMIAFDFRRRIPQFLKEALNESILIFLGYQIDDLDCRVLFRGIVKQLGLDRNSGNITVWQLPESDRAREKDMRTFAEKCCTGAEKIYFGSVRRFLADLRTRWRGIHGEG